MTAKQSMSGVVLPRTSTAYQEEPSAQAVAAPQGYWRAALPRYGVSVLLEKRAVAVNIGLSAALMAACVLYLSLGSVTLSPNAVVASLLGQGDRMTAFMVQQLRLPRLIAACFTGAAFALAGVLMQTLARNRLATPGIIGIDNGATAFAVASIVGLGVGIAPPAMALAARPPDRSIPTWRVRTLRTWKARSRPTARVSAVVACPPSWRPRRRPCRIRISPTSPPTSRR